MTNSADDAVEVKPSSTSLHTQLVRFISVGVFTAAIDYGLTLLLTYLGPVSYTHLTLPTSDLV